MTRFLAAATLSALAALAGCYDTPRPECAFSCGPEGECPEGYACRADGWCKRDDVPADFTCAPPVTDAAPAPDAAASSDAGGADAALFDAAVPDAGPDAT